MAPTPEDPQMMLIEAEIETKGDGRIDDTMMNKMQTSTLDCRHMLENLECESGIFSQSDLAICPRVDLSKCWDSMRSISHELFAKRLFSPVILLVCFVEINLSDRLLSRGAFHNIFQKSSEELSIHTVDTIDNDHATDERSIISSSSSLRSEKVFAIKRLRKDLVKKNLVRKGHCELVKEAKLLAN